jgi:hypothetical protein
MITDKIDSIEGILTKLGIIINKYVDDEDDDIDNIYDFVQYIVNISVFVNHVVIVFWGPNEGDRKSTYIPRLFSEYMLTFRVE